MSGGLSQTVAALGRLKHLARRPPGTNGSAKMTERHGFGSNPGALKMLVYAPADLPPGSPLVVVLHGCGQGAEAYAAGAGWLELADRAGFVVVAAEQSAANNANRCFNWFEPGDVAKGQGEVASIRQMVRAAIGDCDLDPKRVFITGLSAGGAMANAVLAAYPAVFAGGAIVAGLPYGAADDVMSAFGAMFQPQPRSGRELGDRVRNATRYDGPWPRVSIWHGDADATVQFVNADEIAKQWVDVHGLDHADAAEDRALGPRHRVWSDLGGRPVVETYAISGLGHGTPLAAGGAEGLGAPGPFLLEAGISSTAHIAEFWGLPLADEAWRPAEKSEPVAEAARLPAVTPHPLVAAPTPLLRPVQPVHEVITKALTAAGLMKG